LAGAGLFVHRQGQGGDGLGDQPGAGPHGGDGRHLFRSDHNPRGGVGRGGAVAVGAGEAEPGEDGGPYLPRLVLAWFHQIIGSIKKSRRSPSSLPMARAMAMIRATAGSIFSETLLLSGLMSPAGLVSATTLLTAQVSSGSLCSSFPVSTSRISSFMGADMEPKPCPNLTMGTPSAIRSLTSWELFQRSKAMPRTSKRSQAARMSALIQS